MNTNPNFSSLSKQAIIRMTLFLIGFLPLLAAAQGQSVRFQLREPDGSPATGLMCTLQADGAADVAAFAFTDSTGSALLNVAEKGKYKLNVLSFGKSLHTQEADVNGPVDLGYITLRAPSLALDTVMVTATRRAVKNIEGRIIFDVSSLPLKADYTAVDALVRTPLVSYSSDGLLIAGLGAEIRINGIPQRRAGGLYAYLSSIPIERVARIEVHAGRTAELDAGNRGGYVDIILKSLYGVSGFLRSNTVYYGRSYNASRSALFYESLSGGLTYGRERWSAFANIAFGGGQTAGVKSRRETIFSRSGERRTGSNVINSNRHLAMNADLGFSFRPNELHIFSIESSVVSSFPPTNESEGMQLSERAGLRKAFHRTTETNRNTLQANVLGNYRYSSKDNKNSVVWLANYIYDHQNEEANWDVRYTQPETRHIQEVNTNRSLSEMFYTQLSYTRQLISNLKLTAGAKYTRTSMRNENGYSEGLLPAIENRFRYVEQIPAAFVDAGYTHGPLYLSAGVRAEHTDLASHDGDIKQTYTGLYPSLSASFNFTNGLSARLSYSRTLFRPPFQLLTHYSVKMSEQEYSVGNPLLQAERDNNISLRLTSGAHSLVLRWGYAPNPITNVVFDRGDTLFITNINAPAKYDYAASYSFGSRIRSWWHLSANVEFTHMYLPQSQYERRITQVFLSMRHTFTIARSINVDLNANYASPWIMNDTRIADRFKMDLSARYTFPRSHITLALTGQNLLARRRREAITSNLMLRNVDWNETAPMSLLASLTWRFSAGRKQINQERIQDRNMDKYRL